MVPEGWKVSKVAELPGQAGRPVTKLGPFGSAIKKSDYETTGYKVYGQQQVLAGNEDFGDYWIGNHKYAELKACAVTPGDILLSTMGSFGSILRLSEKSQPGIINPRLLRLSIRHDIAAPEYLEYFLQSDLAKRQFTAFAQGGTMPAINGSSINSLKVQLPPLEEQKEIAAILSTWDNAIKATEKLIINAQTQKKALMQQLLTGKKRFPEFDGNEWRGVRLSEVLASKRKKGKVVRINNKGDGIPYIGATSLQGKFSEYTADPKVVKATQFDLLVLWDGEYAGTAGTGLEGAVSSTVAKYSLNKNKINNQFLLYLVTFHNKKITAIREGSGVPHIPKDFDRWFQFDLPAPEEQKQIVSVIQTAERGETGLTKQLASLQKQKKSLMQQLLTGKRRVKT